MEGGGPGAAAAERCSEARFHAYQPPAPTAAMASTAAATASGSRRRDLPKRGPPGPVADGVRFTPCAVRSKTHARTTATGKPRTRATSTALSTQFGRSAPCMIGSVTWRTANEKMP